MMGISELAGRISGFFEGLFSALPGHGETIIMMWCSMLILGAVAVIGARRIKEKPSGFQNLIEFGVETLQGMIRENLPEIAWGSFPVIAGIFLFILVMNLLGLIPIFKSPTGDINVTIAMALVVFGLMIYYGIKSKGFVGYIKSFFKPYFIFFPLNIIETLTKPLTLALRLFGNIFAGELLIVILARLVPIGVPVVMELFHGFIGVIQAYLFVMLAIAYIAVACEEE